MVYPLPPSQCERHIWMVLKALHHASRRRDVSWVKRMGYFLTSPIARLYLNQKQFVLENRMLDLSLALERTPSWTEEREKEMTAVRKVVDNQNRF